MALLSLFNNTANREYDRVANVLRRPGKEQAAGVLDGQELVRLATLAASSHNSQPWRFLVGDHHIAVLPDLARRCPVVDPEDAHLFKSLGCAAENLVHAAAAQGYDADVSFNPANEQVIVQFNRSASAKATELFHAIPRRQCTRTPYDGRRLPLASLKLLEQAGRGSGVRTELLTTQAQLDSVTAYVTRGNEAQLTDPEFRKELISWIRFNPREALRRGDGLTGRTSGRPALPTWLGSSMARFLLTAKGQTKADVQHIRSSAAIAVFISDRDTEAAWVEVGRAYERFALQAAALDIRNAFVNQPIEVPGLRSQFQSWLGLRDEHALLLARMGQGPLAPFSLRRPIEEVLVPPSPVPCAECD